MNADDLDETTISMCALEVSCDKEVKSLLADDNHESNIIEMKKFLEYSRVGSCDHFLPESQYMNVKTALDMFQLVEKAYENTDKSSRTLKGSHVFFSFRVNKRDDISQKSKIGYFTFVDLAVSESLEINRSSAFCRSQNVNRSLGSLIDLLVSWLQSKRLIPYRDSYLSQLLQNSLNHKSCHICLFLFSDSAPALTDGHARINQKDFFLQTWLERGDLVVF